MRYDFVEAHRDRWPVRLMCRVLHVSPGGYYDWRGRPQSATAQRREALIVSIKAIHGEIKATASAHNCAGWVVWRIGLRPDILDSVSMIRGPHGSACGG